RITELSVKGLPPAWLQLVNTIDRWRNLMHRFASFAAVAVLPLAVASSSGALAQQKTIKEMIAGSWSIVSAIDKYEDGTSKNPWGPGVKGNTLFDGNGHFSQILIS